ncbi:VOC family protein [Paenibacillus sp.]|uniref:VOC family protein n=1 Tax=Paenibacillus sp. TaxID=58172 RepID=UPI002D529BB5|nr:VOC family protein [Paenibacillus sp.]HZG86915.1 VOC family protein [Paenibacillus sp.]
MNRVVHFELLSRRPERTAAFYADVFGWRKVEAAEGYWRLISDDAGGARGINGATVRPISDALPPQTVNTVQVENLDAYAEKVRAHGGRTLSDVLPLPGVGRFQYCADPEGIPFGLIEYAR